MHEGFMRGQDIFQRYRIISQLGAGGFGAVFKAEQVTTQQKVAIKVLIAGTFAASEMKREQQKRFWREVALTGKLSNPHTVRLIDSGFMAGSDWQNVLDNNHIQDDRALETIRRFIGEDAPVMVLELVQGRSLRDVLNHEGAMSPSRARRICGHMLESLAEAHAIGIVHRDLKPENIMITGAGKLISAKVLDFGISGVIDSVSASALQGAEMNLETITKEGQVRGTPSYMAPEQMVMFSEPRIETDIYAIGLILLECLTGKQVMTGTSSIDICRKQLQESPEIPKSVWDAGLGDVILKATQKNPNLRYANAEEMFSAIHIDDDAADSSSSTPHLSVPKIERVPAENLSISQNQPLAGDLGQQVRHRYLPWTLLALAFSLVVGIVALVFALRSPDRAGINSVEAMQPPVATPPEETAQPPHATKTDNADKPDPNDQLPQKNTSERELEEKINNMITLGGNAYIAGLIDEAQRYFDAALALQANHPDALIGLGRCALARHDVLTATTYFQKAMVNAQDPIPVILDLSEALKQQGKIEEARALIERYIQTFPDHHRSQDLKKQLSTISTPIQEPTTKTDEKPTVKDSTKKVKSNTKVKIDKKDNPAEAQQNTTTTPVVTPINTGVNSID